MICKRGNNPCNQIGCNCYKEASAADVDFELRAQGFTDEDLERLKLQTEVVLRLCKEKLKMQQQIEDLTAENGNLKKALNQAKGCGLCVVTYKQGECVMVEAISAEGDHAIEYFPAYEVPELAACLKEQKQ